MTRDPGSSIAIQTGDLVRPATRERVLAVIEDTGFVPDASAQGLSRRRKDIIGLVAVERGHGQTDIERTSLLFVDQLVHAAEAVLRGSDCSLLLSFGRPEKGFQRRIRALSGKVDGLLVVEEALPAAQVEGLAQRVPVVTIAGGAGEPAVDAVRVDNARWMRALAAHLMDGHGCRRLAFAAGPADAPDAVERRAAFCAAVRERPGAPAPGPRPERTPGPGPMRGKRGRPWTWCRAATSPRRAAGRRPPCC